MCSRIFKSCMSSNGNREEPSKLPPARGFICPSCGFKLWSGSVSGGPRRRSTFTDSQGKRESVSLPAGSSPALLLDHSPTPQLLLSDNNRVLYSNKSASSLLGRVILEDDLEDIADQVQLQVLSRGKSATSWTSWSANAPPASAVGHRLEGLMLEQLPIELVRADMRRWISFEQVLENVKNALKRKQEYAGMGLYANVYDEFYAEGSREDDNGYYSGGEASQRKSVPKEAVPVVITKTDGELVNAYVYVSLVAATVSDVRVALSIVPNTSELDASFHVPIRRSRTGGKTRDSPKDLIKVGRTGEDIIERAARLKDLILDEMEFAFLCLTPDGELVITNKACRDMVGGAEAVKAAVGEGYDWISRLDIWRADFSEQLPFSECAIHTVISEKKPVQQTIGLLVKGKKVIVDLKGTPLWENPKKQDILLAALLAVVDQTERTAREREIARSGEVKKAFLMNLSRGLKIPVAGIISILEMLHETGLKEEQQALVHEVFSGVNSLLLAMNDLIDFNKIDSRELTIDRSIFILQHLVADIKTLFSQSMAKDGVDFIVDTSGISESDFGDGTLLLLDADEGKIRRIVINILSNAFKFTSHGSVHMKVSTTKAKRGSLELQFQIEDTGIGISEDDIKTLFLPINEMVGSDIMGKNFRYGFGLSIAKSFANLLQGDILCSSVVDVGSTFRLWVPCDRPFPDSKITVPHPTDTLSGMLGIVLRSVELESAIKEDDVAPKGSVDITGANILLVGANWSDQVITKKRLEKMGCIVETAITGQNAISMMTKGEIEVDVVFMDLRMPLLDGFESTALIRKAEDPSLGKYRDVPIVAVTAIEMAGDRARAKDAGANYFTLKPLHNDKLKELVERFLEAGRSRGHSFADDGSRKSITLLPRVDTPAH